jgi:hypothetical protein
MFMHLCDEAGYTRMIGSWSSSILRLHWWRLQTPVVWRGCSHSSSPT